MPRNAAAIENITMDSTKKGSRGPLDPLLISLNITNDGKNSLLTTQPLLISTGDEIKGGFLISVKKSARNLSSLLKILFQMAVP